MTSNLKRWLYDFVILGLFGLSMWQCSVGSSLTSGKAAFPHLVVGIVLLACALILLVNSTFGGQAARRAVMGGCLGGFVWYILKALNGFVLDLNVEKQKCDLLRGIACGLFFLVFLAYQVKKDTDRFQG